MYAGESKTLYDSRYYPALFGEGVAPTFHTFDVKLGWTDYSSSPYAAICKHPERGIGFQIDGTRIREVLRILMPRYAVGFLLAALCFLLLPVPPVYRKALIIPFLGPVSNAAPAFTAQMQGDYELASAVNSVSILISIVLIISALAVIL